MQHPPATAASAPNAASAPGHGVDHVVAAYGDRADEYAAVLGSMRAVHPEDRALVEAWADATPGLLLDVGYGPGHWAAHLHRRGHVVVGIEPVPRFVALARAAAPEVEFRPGTSEATGLPDAGAGGVLSWYALVHHEPTRVPAALAEVHRVLAPDGTLLVGFFEGPTLEPFDHAVTTAYRWPVERMVAVLQDAGFTVDTVQRRADVGARPHAAVIARRS